MLTILFDGIAYGMLLFVLAVGLAVTMGLMNFINLAHGAFAMVGGYITVLLMQRLDVPFLVCLPLAFAGAAPSVICCGGGSSIWSACHTRTNTAPSGTASNEATPSSFVSSAHGESLTYTWPFIDACR